MSNRFYHFEQNVFLLCFKNYIFAHQLWLLVTVPVLLRHSSIQLTAIDLVIVEALLLACCDRCCVYCAQFFRS